MNGIRIEGKGPLAVMRLDKARGNAIDEALVEAVVAATAQLAADDSVKGVLFASAHPKVFCPGLDLVGLLEYDRPSMQRFMGRFAEALWALYTFPKPMVAALNGHAVAGGCILALTADYRVLRRGGAQIGLNEVKVGVPLPWSVATLLRFSVPPSSLSTVALLGRNFADEEAVSIGLVDALAPAEGFEEACLVRLAEFAEKDPLSVSITKRYLRVDALAQMKTREAEATREFLDAWFSEATRRRIGETVAALGKKA